MLEMANSNNDNQQDPRKSWSECSQRQSKLRKDLDYLFRDVSDEWHEAATRNDFSQLDEVKNLPECLNETNFVPTMETLLKMERAYDAINQRIFDMFEQELVVRKIRDNLELFYFIKADELSDGQPSLVRRDTVILRNSEGYRITNFNQTRGPFIISEDTSLSRGSSEGPWDVSFVSCGSRFKDYAKGLSKYRYMRVERRLFQGDSEYVDSVKCESKFPDEAEMACDLPEAEERMKQLDAYQQRAVMNIVKNTSWPKPYILFGPPGTGKTHIVAEAIAQIYVRKPDSQILYCASSNICVNQMIDKLGEFGFIQPNHIGRLSAGQGPNEVTLSRIILTTNMKCSTITYDFTVSHVFIDEAGQANEMETLLPISCLKDRGCLVLAGELKQLGAYVICDQTLKYGLGISLLERLLTTVDFYKRDKSTGQYDHRYITKLLLSYRCDPRILAISNRLFYDNELLCANETPKSILKMMNITNPLQLIHVEGRNVQPANSTSWRNDEEADRCVDLIVRLYKMGLTPEQIGVISPYKLQTKSIYQKLKERLSSLIDFLEERFREVERIRREKAEEMSAGDSSDQVEKISTQGDAEVTTEVEWIEQVKRRADGWLCKISSVNAFQGNEREVIIISTVRTPSSASKDFINDPRRFNVAISRAKWLVFVVGHKDVLKEQSNWSEFLKSASEELSS